MKFDVAAIKNVLKEAGYEVTKGEQMLAHDVQQLEHYAYFVWGIAKEKLHLGMAYPSTLPSGFPGTGSSTPQA
jgi:hypothetical protein